VWRRGHSPDEKVRLGGTPYDRRCEPASCAPPRGGVRRQILKGANAGDLPVEQPAVFDFVVNLKTAEALRRTIPPSVQPQLAEWIQ
jgi:hypothetical protein